MWRFLTKVLRFRKETDSGGGGLVRRQMMLSATRHGLALAAQGQVQVFREGSWQRFLLEFQANVEDGTVFHVAVNNRPISPVVIGECEGDLDIASTEDGDLPMGFPEVAGIRTITLSTPDGKPVLVGVFDAWTDS